MIIIEWLIIIEWRKSRIIVYIHKERWCDNADK